MRVLKQALCAIALLAAVLPARAAPEPLTAAQAQSVVDAVSANVQKIYVIPELRGKIVEAIRADAAKGRYAVASQAQLAERISETLAAASSDKHLNVTFDPPRAKALGLPQEGPGAAFFDAEGLRQNQGYVRQEILPGNIRFVRIKGFYWTKDVTPGVIDSAARFLAGGSAVIIDLRGNGGGSAEAVQRMISYMMPEKSTLLMTFFDGRTGKSEISNSIAKLPSPRMTGRPIYVLTDGGSASASEEFAYHIQQFKLGTLIGETTAGAAHNNVLLPLPEGFVASVSYGRPIHPVSKANWEGVGVVPDKRVPSAAALDVAVLEALTAMSKGGDAQAKADAEWEIPALQARLNPIRVAPEDLKRLTGKYGEREVRWTEDGLTMQRAGRPVIRLSPMGGGTFAAIGIDDVRFKFTGESAATLVLEISFRDGRKIAVKRDGNPG